MSHTIESISGRTGVLACLLTAAMAVACAEDVDPKTAAETAKAIAEAKKAETEAEAAAAKARLGTLADYKTDGTSEVGTGSGKLEAMLLATEATRKSAELMARQLVTRIGAAAQDTANPKAVFVIGESEKLNYEAYDSFRVQAMAIQRQFEAALATKPGAAPAPEEISAATSATAALTTLGMISNLFRSDYKISSLDLTADDMALAKSVMAAAIEKGLTIPLHVPGLYSTPLTPESNPAVARLQELDTIRTKVTTALTSMSAARDDLIARAKQDAKQAAKLRAQAAQYAQPITALEIATKRYDDYIAKISAADDKGAIPLTAIARQAYLADRFAKGSYLLVLKANYLGGSAYAKKNFWTFFGAMPFYVAGGAVSSYTLIEGSTGAILDAGVFAHTAPFAKVHTTVGRYVDSTPASK